MALAALLLASAALLSGLGIAVFAVLGFDALTRRGWLAGERSQVDGDGAEEEPEVW